MAACDFVCTDVDVNRFVHDLGLVEEGFHGANSDKGSEFIDFRDSAFNDLLVVHAKQNSIKLDPLVNGSIAVNNASSADGFVIVGDENKAVFGIEFSFKSVHGETVDVLIEGLPLTHVFRRNADDVFLGYDLVHFITSLRSQEAQGRR